LRCCTALSDDQVVGCWFHGDRLLHQAKKELASARRLAAVETEGELIQMVVQRIRPVNCAYRKSRT